MPDPRLQIVFVSPAGKETTKTAGWAMDQPGIKCPCGNWCLSKANGGIDDEVCNRCLVLKKKRAREAR